MKRNDTRTNATAVKEILNKIKGLDEKERESFIRGLRHISKIWDNLEDIFDILRQQNSPRREYRQFRKELRP